MNDFTKEELESILEAFHYARDSPCWNKYYEEPELQKKIQLMKIQSMIDNYCDHECKHELKRQHLQIDLCEKCNSFKFVVDSKSISYEQLKQAQEYF